MIDDALRISGATAIQLDFDAPRSAYPFYRSLLTDVRRRHTDQVFVSMTALMSWCGERSWMTGLPVDEIVAHGVPIPSARAIRQCSPS